MDKEFFERTEEDHSRWEGAPKERKLQSRININRDATDHNSFSMRIRIQNIIAAEEAEDDEVRLILQSIFLQQGKLLSGMCHRIAGINDLNTLVSIMFGKAVFEQGRIILVFAPGPAKRVAQNYNAKMASWFLKRIVTIIEAEGVRVICIGANSESEIRIVLVEIADLGRKPHQDTFKQEHAQTCQGCDKNSPKRYFFMYPMGRSL